MPAFTLACPNCGATAIVEADEPVIDWVCPDQSCEATPVTSLPTDDQGNLL